MSQAQHAEAERAIARIARALDDKRLTINALEDGSGVVLDVDGERMLGANAVGIAIVQAIADGQRNAAAIAGFLARDFEVPQERALEDLRRFVCDIGRGF